MSIVRNNLMERPGYSPYCGHERCTLFMPRTTFDGAQFRCGCGWRSEFDAEFIAQYKTKWAIETHLAAPVRCAELIAVLAILAAQTASAMPAARVYRGPSSSGRVIGEQGLARLSAAQAKRDRKATKRAAAQKGGRT